MLSNPTTALHNRQRQHRRQNSTPNAFDGVKVQNLPNIQRAHAHRRGMSLDQRRRQTPPQDNNTNLGYQTTPQQHILRETQQQRLARPGQSFTTFDNDENYLHSPIVTPHRQSFDAVCASPYGEQLSSPHYAYTGPINTIMQVDPNLFNGNNDFNLFASDSALTPSAYLDFSGGFDGQMASNDNSRRSSAGRRISVGLVERVSQFENMSMNSPRPMTPPNQNITDYFPPTPINTPFHRVGKHEQVNRRFLDEYDTSMEETIKPKGNQRARGVFDDMRKEAEARTIPSPPHSTQMPSNGTFDSAPMPGSNFMNMSNLNTGFVKNEQHDGMVFLKHEQNDGSSYSPQSSNHSYQSSPAVNQMSSFSSDFDHRRGMGSRQSDYDDPEHHGLPTPGLPDSYRRSESVDSINIEEIITETGITIDDIATFISGPDPKDGRWLCLYPECKKSFGRKENIKSHVQTHLGDRQFQCPHCKKCFVRQHDLKRHAKIHSGVKPYPCQCGNSFARMDALTRHRQRGMCIGAFEGVVKKTVKRGRPRKNRPDDEERLEKSSRTRSKNKAMSSSSSSAGGSQSNAGQSPRSDLDDILDEKPFGGYEFNQNSTADNSAVQYSQTQSPSHSACVSPQLTQTAPSPSSFSNHSAYNSHRPSVSSEHLPSHPSSPIKSRHPSPYHSPPGLCESSSSPAPSHHYYEMASASANSTSVDFKGLANINEHDDEMFLEAFANNGMGQMTGLERDPDMSMEKYGGDFSGVGDEMFRSETDVFFGSP